MSARLVLAAAVAGACAAAGMLWTEPSRAQEAEPILPGLPSARNPSASQAEDGSWIWGDVAVLRGLDKVTAVTRDFEAPVGEDVRFFALTISVKRCAKRPPEEPPEVIVGMEIHDRQTDGEGNEIEPERVFAGWMFESSPALNPLEHGVYDVWVLDCLVPETEDAES
ncbi:MAG: DUF2155 domain-containing protein [Maricaulaceae bacterium]|jgi:hypothetical protein